MRSAMAVFLAAFICLTYAAPWDRCFGTNGSTNYSIVSDDTYTSINNGFGVSASPTYYTVLSIGNIYGDTSAGSYFAGLGPLYTTPPYVLQFDFLNQNGGNFNINYSVADMGGVLTINQTSITPSSGSCGLVSSQIVGEVLNIYYQCSAVASNGSVTIEAMNDLGLVSRVTRGVVSSNEAFHCFFGLTPTTLGTATLAVSYLTSDPSAQVAISLNGNHVGYLTGSGTDTFIGMPVSWLSNTSVVDYVFAHPSENNVTVNITSSTISYYGGRSFYSNYSMDFQYGIITVQDTGVYYANYQHATLFERFIVGIAGYFPLIIAVALLLLVWRLGAYWERTNT